jgi:uncharacterized membrane protein
MRSKWLMLALVVSVVLNLLLAGFVIGRLSGPGPVPAALDPSVGMFRVLPRLPEPRREALEPRVREHFRALRDELRRMRATQRSINQALAAEPFSAEDLTAALARFRAALLASQEQNHALLVDIAADMSAAERRLLRDAMTRRRPPGHRDPGDSRP